MRISRSEPAYVAVLTRGDQAIKAGRAAESDAAAESSFRRESPTTERRIELLQNSQLALGRYTRTILALLP